ncbi:FG-GAP-like repeat-containing protein [Streptacidiphilus melanogenes]|uniref:FG-GAP-like repeat-containing protein n=1 Tax=Streptacidiphilus melanogenes TaxID=411235 RepID=UPI0007C69205|nr:FG-GAP-like repeat-containing protein [Streptacidiphilus melanogenes]
MHGPRNGQARPRRAALAALVVMGVSAAGLTPAYAAAPAKAVHRNAETSGSPEPTTHQTHSDKNLGSLPNGFGITPTDQVQMRRASASAKKSGKAVVVDSLTTPTEEVLAEPSGKFELAANPHPVRVHTSGGWAPVDLRLSRQSDGTLAPKETAYGTVSFSGGGGSAPLAVIRSNGTSVALSWPGTLPTPQVNGVTATYASVLPGVDLQVSATSSGGFSFVLVIHSAQAAQNPELRTLHLGTVVHGGRLVQGRDGGLTVLDSTGRQVADGATPMQWDSNTTLPTSAHPRAGKVAADRSDADHPGLAARVATVGTHVAPGSLTLTPNTSMLTSKSTVWPVYEDPNVNWHPATGGTPMFDEVKQGCPGNSFTNQTGSLADNGYLGVGYNGWQEGYCYTGDEHAVYQWNLPRSLYHADINTATVNATDIYSASCSTTASVNLHWSKGMGSGTDWSNRPGYNSYSTSASFGPAYNPQYCSSNGSVTNGFNVLSPIRSEAASGATTFTVTLSEDSMESSHNDLGFKRFSNNPTLQIFFNNPPNPPTAETMSAVAGADNVGCDTASPYPYMGKTIASTPPVLKAKVTDPNGDKLQATFQYWLDGSSTKTTMLSGDNLASGTSATASLPSSFISSLTNGQTVDWDVKFFDGMDSTSYTQSPTCHFNAEPTAPDNPTVASVNNLYPDIDATDSPTVGATAGTAGQFSISGNGTTATKFVYNLDQKPANTNPPANETVTATNNAATITVTPQSPGVHTLYVYSVDAANDVSGDRAYRFMAAGTPNTTCNSFSSCLNNVAISPDNNMGLGAADGYSSMSATDLTNAGWTSGGKVTVDGATFALPAYGSGQKDNVVAANQTITMPAGTGGNALVFLTNATNTNPLNTSPGAIAGQSTAPYVPENTPIAASYCFTGTTPVGVCPTTGTITYTNGTSTTFTLTVPDWVSGPQSIAAVSLPHWNRPSGQVTAGAGQGLKIYPFSVPIDPTLQVQSVTLPDVSGSGTGGQALHVYGISTRNTTAGTPEVNGTYAATPSGQSWTGAWANANEGNYNFQGSNFSNQTFRIALKPSLSGGTVRIKLDNGIGTSTLNIGHATIALSSNSGSPSATPSGTPTTLKFGGSQSVVVPQGGAVYSDPLSFSVTAGQYLLVSYQLTNSVPYLVQHSYANGSYQYMSASGSGDKTTDTTGTPFSGTGTYQGNYTDLVTGLDVQSANVPTEAVLGDNLTDPFQPNTSPPNSNGLRVSDALSSAEPTSSAPFGVLAEGIESNQLMTDNPETLNGGAIGGPSALSRIDRDILDQPGINTVVVSEGLEDLLARSGDSTAGNDLENNGYQALVQQLNGWGINVVLTSLTPCQGFGGDGATPNDPCTGTTDTNRVDVNAYLGGNNLGGPWGTPAVYFADFDGAVSAPSAYAGEERLAPWADSGDHANLSLAGYGALSDAILNPQNSWQANDGNGMPVATDTAATDTPQTPGTILNSSTGQATLTLSGTGATWGDDPMRGTVLNLDGTAGTATDSSPVLDTSKSFTVSAWVKLPSAPTHNMTIAAQQGAEASSFYLQYNYANQSKPAWDFSVTNGDTASPGFTHAISTSVNTGQWTHLVGVYNAAAKTTQLYVNGALAASASGVTTWNAPNSFTVGSALYNATPTDFFSGSVSGVQTYAYALSGNQASALYLSDAAGGPYVFADSVDMNGDGHPDLVAQAADGDLWIFWGDGSHGPSPSNATLLGWAFESYTIAGIADFNGDGYPDIVARDSSGNLWLYPGDANHDTSTPRVQIGNGWGSYSFAGVRDWNGDGKPDVVAKDSAGTLWNYPGTGGINGTSTLGTRVQIGTSWSTYTLSGLVDWDKDGHMDLVAMDSSGNLWLYPGDANHDTSTARVELGTGWTNFPVEALADWNGDGNPDIITRGPGAVLWDYPGNGTRTSPGARFQIGVNW